MKVGSVLGLLLGLTFISQGLGCGQSSAVELWVISELRDEAELARLDFVIRDAQIQPSGFEVFADHRVSDEWKQLEVVQDTIDLVAAQTEPVMVARGQVAAGDYDRVFLRPSGFDALNTAGSSLVIKNVMEPTVVSFSYDSSGTRQIVLEIIAIATRGDEDYSVFAKDARVQ